MSAIGKPSANQVLARYVASQAITLVQSLCRGSAGVAATASYTVTVKRNGSNIATFVWSASGTLPSVTITASSISAGDVLTWHAPASADTTLADIAMTLAGER